LVTSYRGFQLRIFTNGAFVDYFVTKGPATYLAGQTRVENETEQQVLSRLKARMDSESLDRDFHPCPSEGKGRL